MKKKVIKTTYDRILEISEDSLQITLPDSRYYKRHGKFYPSITYILGCYPKGKHFEDWLKKHGYTADYLVRKAADEGTQVHDMAERYLDGEKLKFMDERYNFNYPIDVWRMFLKFVEFWERYKPTLIDRELHLFSDIYEVAGTCDLICEIDGVLWLIDFKTSNYISNTFELQTSMYSQCFEECYGKKIEKTGVLWLKSNKRKSSTTKMQGKGWEMIEPTRSLEENLSIFECVKTIFDLENPKPSPNLIEFRTEAQISK